MLRRSSPLAGVSVCLMLLAGCGDDTAGTGGSGGSGPSSSSSTTSGSTGTATATTGSGAVCGDGNVDVGEDCDTSVGNETCIGLGFDGGTLLCGGNCAFDTSGCTSIGCGDNVINTPTEQCDGADLNNQNCTFFGFDGGTLTCTANCQYSTTLCVSENCFNTIDDDGDNAIDCADTNCATECADACTAPPTLADPSTNVAGDTTGHAAIYDESCGSATTGPEVIYQLTVQTNGMLDVSITSDADLGISVLTACASGELACADVAFGAGGVENLSVPVTAGQVVFIMVDGYTASEEGAFTISAASRPIVCGDGLLEGAESCDDGNAANNDGCSNTCLYECGVLNCNDNNACTADSCTPQAGCGTTPVDPNDFNACTTDSCNPATGVVNTPVNIDDSNGCTTDACNPATGAITHTPVNINDNNACTADSCNPATGIISHTPNPIPSDNNACTTDSCNPANGASVYTQIPNCCAHSQCSTGVRLDAASCSYTGANNNCATTICQLDSFCCNNNWDSTCAGHTSSAAYCTTGLAAPNNTFSCACSHSYCAAGAALVGRCDPCVKKICEVDPFCCANSWDSACVAETNSVCRVPTGANCL